MRAGAAGWAQLNSAAPSPADQAQNWTYMSDEFTYRITTTRFDEDYSPAQDSRATTNFANLARREHRRQNPRNTPPMINTRFTDTAHRDNPNRHPYPAHA